ncbi:hypothetical protein K435DRAFT_774381 [Dendrothele bispora CBS 962.96]|uniref:BZIP domain-containing protein n=1 Tax=Dendrothele bispora (strain CBS 962.96) TaxID=1314807 RepID=A0A4S8MQG8_DENBC|nr:hypothetical protein K435DRAFT_774381 [Dendrothele bispora CBS 962.96]
MTRGRKKDLTIPPSRALTQQRDYRARKALYVSELEDRCRRVEAENTALRAEIDALRAGLPFTNPIDPRLMSASSELLKDLNNVSVALTHFQNLAYPQTSVSIPPTASAGSPGNMPSQPPGSRLRPAFFPSPTPSSSSLPTMSGDVDSGRASSERSWPEETSRAPESLRKILCDSNSDSPGYTSSMRLSQDQRSPTSRHSSAEREMLHRPSPESS